MTVRAVEGKKPYTGGIGIEITEDKVINLRLRGENNLIEYDEGDNEIYVDLQLDDEITPTDELPVGITTGRIIVDNGWEFTGTIIVAKTTSGDLIKFVYADDGKVYIDNGTGTFKQIYLKSDIDTLINALKVEIKAYVDEHDTVVSDTAPSDAYQGQLWYDTTTNKLKTYDGTQWNEIAGGATYSAGAGISIDQNNQISNSLPGPVVASSAPSNPVEGALWYDTTNDVLKSYDGTQWNNVGDDNPNVKAFYITSTGTSAVAKVQGKAVLDWYKAGKTPIVIYSNKAYNLASDIGFELDFSSDTGYTDVNNQGYTTLIEYVFTIEYSSNSVLRTSASSRNIINVIRTGHNYSTSYTPPYKGSPTPREYVDDRDTYIGSSAPTSNLVEGRLWYDTTNDVLKSYDGTNWNAVGGATYTAGEGIEILDIQDYSAMQGPAPDGFHVPLTTEWQAVYDIWTALGGGSDDGTNFGIALKLPFAGSRHYSSAGANVQGSRGCYWSSSRSDSNNAYYLTLNSTALNPQNASYRATGFSVRCFKDTPTVPTSSWTKLYGTSIEAGGIFWSSTDGLISLSSDGNTWITIADKNLGATTVWNSGDTLSEANCGKYYQRGNNYGFPRTGTIANQSTTQVGASNYGPGNYYSSDTFIKGNKSWDSTDNGNLWGGVTGVVTLDNAITNTGVLSVNGQTGDVTIQTGGTYTAGRGISIDQNNEISIDTSVVATQSDISVVSGDSGTTYTIKVSNTAPAAGTPDTTLTFVY